MNIKYGNMPFMKQTRNRLKQTCFLRHRCRCRCASLSNHPVHGFVVKIFRRTIFIITFWCVPFVLCPFLGYIFPLMFPFMCTEPFVTVAPGAMLKTVYILQHVSISLNYWSNLNQSKDNLQNEGKLSR